MSEPIKGITTEGCGWFDWVLRRTCKIMSTEVKRLTEFKQRVLALYDTFTRDEIDAFSIGQARTMMHRLRPLCDAGKLQLEILLKFFNEDILSRFQQKWDSEQLIWRKTNMASAIELIMQLGYIAV